MDQTKETPLKSKQFENGTIKRISWLSYRFGQAHKNIETSTVEICLTSLVGVKLCLWHLNLSPILSWGLNSGNRHKLHSPGTLHNGGAQPCAFASTFCRYYQMGPTSTNATWWSVHKKNLLPHCIIPSHPLHTCTERQLWCCSGSSRQMTYTFHRSCAWMQFLHITSQ